MFYWLFFTTKVIIHIITSDRMVEKGDSTFMTPNCLLTLSPIKHLIRNYELFLNLISNGNRFFSIHFMCLDVML